MPQGIRLFSAFWSFVVKECAQIIAAAADIEKAGQGVTLAELSEGRPVFAALADGKPSAGLAAFLAAKKASSFTGPAALAAAFAAALGPIGRGGEALLLWQSGAFLLALALGPQRDDLEGDAFRKAWERGPFIAQLTRPLTPLEKKNVPFSAAAFLGWLEGKGAFYFSSDGENASLWAKNATLGRLLPLQALK